MRIENVHPGKPAAWLAAEPRQGRIDDLSGRPFSQGEVGRIAGPTESVIVDVESVCEAKPPLERDATNEGASGESLLLQYRRNRCSARLQAIPAVVADPMLVRVCSCQDAGMRRTRECRVRVREFETQPYRRKVVQIGRTRPSAVRAERIRPERIDCDEQQVLVWLALDIGAPRPASRYQPSRYQEAEGDDG